MQRPIIPEPTTRLGLGGLERADAKVVAVFAVCSLIRAYVGEEETTQHVVRAYIDPGSGALVVQILVSFGVGLLLYLKRVRHALLRLLGRLRGRS